MTGQRFWSHAEYFTLIALAAVLFAAAFVASVVFFPMAFLLDVVKIALNATLSRIRYISAVHHMQRAAAVIARRWK